MTEIINLNKIRKAKKKQKETESAQQNRLTYGISSKTRKLQNARVELESKKLEQARLETAVSIKKVDDEQ